MRDKCDDKKLVFGKCGSNFLLAKCDKSNSRGDGRAPDGLFPSTIEIAHTHGDQHLKRTQTTYLLVELGNGVLSTVLEASHFV
jgi:hypothetical protein